MALALAESANRAEEASLPYRPPQTTTGVVWSGHIVPVVWFLRPRLFSTLCPAYDL